MTDQTHNPFRTDSRAVADAIVGLVVLALSCVTLVNAGILIMKIVQ